RVCQAGGTTDAETGHEIMLVTVRVHADDMDPALDWLLTAVRRPVLTTDVLDRERTAVIQEIAAAEADPSDYVQDRFLATLFAGHPFARPVAGSAESVDEIALADCAANHRDVFLHRPMALTLVGPRLPDGLLPLAGDTTAPALSTVDAPSPVVPGVSVDT